jgi:hypothetical protein
MVNDGIGNGNFTALKPFAFWTQHVLPLVYGDEISYMETLGKMRDILNELIKNNNNLPTYIQQMIEEYISSGAIESVIDKILSNFILNVKYPPTGVPKAKGDGTTNDHDSIQGCIDYAAGLGGGVVYLPAGKYLTSSLVLKPGVTLLGFGRYATSLSLAGGATTHLITGTVSDAGLLNLTLNAKMSSQVNRVDAVELVGNHIEIRNCIVKDCYTSINVQKTGSAINICDVICEVASDACLRIGGTDGGLLVDGLEMTGLSTNLGVAYIVTDSNGDIYRNINIHGTGALGIDVAGSQNYFDGKISGVTKDYEDLSGDNTFELFGKSSVKNYTNDVVENANAFSQVATNGIERQGENISDNSTNTHTINAKDVVLNPTNPLTYKTPVRINDFFKAVPAKDASGLNYNLLVEGANSNIVGSYATVNDLIASDPEEGSFIVQGYYTAGDNIPLIYNITTTSSPAGVTLSGGRYAVPVLTDLVTPETFGIRHTPTTAQITDNNAKWKAFCDFVNTTNGIDVKLMPYVYTVYEPLYFLNVSVFGTSKVGVAGYGDGWSVIKAGATMPVVGNTTSPNGITRNKSCVVCMEGTSLSAHIKFKDVIIIATGFAYAGLFITQYNYLSIEGCTFVGGNTSCVAFGILWMSNFKNCTVKPNQSVHALFLDTSLGSTAQGTSLVFETIHVDINDNICTSAYDFSKLNYSTLICCGCDHMTAKGTPYKFNASYITMESCACEFTSNSPIASCVDITNGNTIMNNFVCYSNSSSIDIDVFAKVSGDNTGLTINGRHYPYFCKKMLDLTGVSYMAIHLNIMNQFSTLDYIASSYPSYGFIVLNAPETVGYVKLATNAWQKNSLVPVA